MPSLPAGPRCVFFIRFHSLLLNTQHLCLLHVSSVSFNLSARQTSEITRETPQCHLCSYRALCRTLFLIIRRLCLSLCLSLRLRASPLSEQRYNPEGKYHRGFPRGMGIAGMDSDTRPQQGLLHRWMVNIRKI